MVSTTLEGEEKTRKIAQKRRKDGKLKGRDLTCTEAEVEGILSEGEST